MRETREDYIAHYSPARARLQGQITRVGILLCISVALASLIFMGKEATAKRHSGLNAGAVKNIGPQPEKPSLESIDAAINESVIAEDHPLEAAIAPEPEPEEDWITITIKPGDTLSVLFEHYGLPSSDLRQITKLGKDIKPLYRVRPGEELRIRRDLDGGVAELQVDLDEIRSLQVLKTGDNGYATHTLEAPVDRQQAYAIGTITSSLFLAANNAGMSDSLAMELAYIFGWDIDFAKDIQSGDRFAVIYEEIYRHGEKISDGDIIAAEFVNRGRKLQAFRYTTPDGRSQFYTPDGKSMRKAFLRTPVDFARISSRFNPGRRHPILNRIRAHRGVDYAARHGTPIKAAGDGKVIFRGRKGGYGNTVIIKHGMEYTTLYAHMSRFGRGISNGSRVEQGQIIGYIGASGLATGPHLHYEFRVNGVHKDPLRVKLPGAPPLEAEHMADFRSSITPALAQLETLHQIRTAARTQ